MKSQNDPFGAAASLTTKAGTFKIFKLSKLGNVERMPYSIKVLLESALRHCDGFQVTEQDVKGLAAYNAKKPAEVEIPFFPGRVVLQDFTGVPCVVDLAAMRSAMKRLGGKPSKINPQVPCDLVIDHSVQVDSFGSAQALGINTKFEFQRNRERYELLRWGQKAFNNFRVVPPATGIVHQVNLEYLAKGVLTRDGVAFPDSCVGTDSHTTMINGLGVLGWGVGGIEAEAVMLGQSMSMLTPEVIGVRITGSLREGATATDVVLTVTQMLRKRGVVNKFVEFTGPGLATLSLADRATIANMAPEYGATCGFFPIDDETLRYLKITGRTAEEVELVERYGKEQGLFRGAQEPDFTDLLTLDLSTIEPSLAGPKRPQDRVRLSDMKPSFRKALTAPVKEQGFELPPSALGAKSDSLSHGSVVIAAITSCTNTSNPSVMIGAGLVAKKAVERGLKVKPTVKTSLAPGSRVVTEYLNASGLTPFLETLGFHTVGYGCTTCIGNSGPLPDPIAAAIKQGNLVASAVLSGNRNFEGRVHPLAKANYLASPPLVVAYALAGTVDIDLVNEPIGRDSSGKDVFLKDLWPTQKEIQDTIAKCVTAEMYRTKYADVSTGPEEWRKLPVPEGELYAWKEESTYVHEPPYFKDMSPTPGAVKPIQGARVLVMVADSVTTDHISPAGDIEEKSPAGQYLVSRGVTKADFNSYGARRGDDRVMTRGTFANIRFRNLLAPGTEGWWTTYLPTGEKMSLFDASVQYLQSKTPLMVLAGKEYGTGSSRDWAAKGPMLLGIRAVIAESYERIHRSNLVGMGILPLQYQEGENREKLGLTGKETFDIVGLDDKILPRQPLKVNATLDGKTTTFSVICRIDTPVEIEYYKNGGILQTVLRKLLKG
jgi:aconitate hydratase